MYQMNFYEKFKPEEVLVYLRKSRTDDPTLTVEEVLQKHESMLDDWAEKNMGDKVPEENKFREVVSGETIEARPEIQRILKMIESPRYRAILVVELQRLSRGDLEDAGRLMKLLRYTNTFVITPMKPFDLRNEYDRDFFERELKRGNEYLEYTKKIMGNGRLLSVSQGNFIGSIPPYGYDKAIVMDGKRKCPTLIENKEQADTVRMIFDLYVNQDLGMKRICNHLEALSIKPPKGKYWSPETLNDMVTNAHYIGKVKWNWRKTVTIVEDSEIIKTRPKAQAGEFFVYDGKHEGIIPEALFYAAQEKKGRHHRAKLNTTIRNPLASLLYCQCGRAMSLKTYENSAARLSCDGQTNCKTGSCLYDEMIERVSTVLKQCIIDFEIKLQNNDVDAAKLQAKLVANLEKRMEELKAKEISQWEMQSHPDPAQRMPAEIFKALNEKLQKEKEEVQQSLHAAYESIPAPVDYAGKIRRFQAALDALNDSRVTALEKNILLKDCIKKITYKRERPERIKRDEGRKKGTQYDSAGGRWTNPPIEVDFELKV